ncbi:hypothetical protein AVEN_122691-1 [Araneus ventricosus]|uniref:Uncharacterized protein n=1 Tax=Araneus ventricosus TaxID=182803 RepID=A0A4Y2P924_ARAVE|nr:hypothetical protein AVEN_122691-1 [Araneus ventricosus]
MKNKNEKIINANDEENYDEYYVSKKYAKSSTGNEKYAKKRGLEFYLTDEDNKPIYARKKINNEEIPFFAKDKRGKYIIAEHNKVPIYPFKDENTPIFPKEGKREIYAQKDNNEIYPENKNQTQFYAKDEKSNEYPAKKVGNKLYYARKRNAKRELIEFAPKKSTNDLDYIKESNGKLKYLFNIDLNTPIFPINNKNESIYFELHNEEYYPTDEKNKQYYAKDLNNFEKLAKSKGKEYYAKDSNNDERYPQRPSGSQYYRIDDKKEVAAINHEGGGFYAKVNNDEYYPRVYDDLTKRDWKQEPVSILFLKRVKLNFNLYLVK